MKNDNSQISQFKIHINWGTIARKLDFIQQK